MASRDMRRIQNPWLILVLAGQFLALALADDFKLLDDSHIKGTPSSWDENGVVFNLDTGGFSHRVNWGKFDQDSLKLLAQNEKLRQLVDPFIEIPPAARPKPKPIILKEVSRIDRPAGRTTFFSSFASPLGLGMVVLLYLANLFAAYEIGRYRNRPVSAVCAVSALLPFLGPLIFLASPTLGHEAAPETEGQVADAAAIPGVPAAGSPGGATSRKVGVGIPAAPTGGGLRVATAEAKPEAGKGGRKIFKRGDYTFNRRFLETQFSGFFRIVPLETEKDLVLVINTPKQEYVGRRISRISSNELFLQLQQGGGTKEVRVLFGEIAQITVRHKDDTGPA